VKERSLGQVYSRSKRSFVVNYMMKDAKLEGEACVIFCPTVF
jgi:hypothetical protein